jgi:2-polyprenyl-3-methyl-5-hydroxy-6-metoxy-1,4-benzoquinol methylase/3-polyprenyl-4-hydroxybenzoate decarboxylase
VTERKDIPLRRAAVVRIYEVGERMVLLAPDGGGHELIGDSARLAAEVLAYLATAHTLAELYGYIEACSGAPLEHPEVIDELLALLRRAGAVEVADARASTPERPRSGVRVVLCLSGAVASMDTPALIRGLQARGHVVAVAATDEALRFVSAEALEALTHRPVVHDMWPVDENHHVPHIELAAWADVVLVCPASATTLERIASGSFSSIVSAIALSSSAPVILVPSMNPAMFTSPPVQRNLAQLIADGRHVVHPARALEVAEPPGARAPVLGGAPPAAVVVQIVDAIVRATAASALTRAPGGADGWDRIYRITHVRERPWETDEADPDLLAAIDRLSGGACSLLEIGTGLGTVALAAAARGHRVVATDIAATAITQASVRPGGEAVIWLEDDITASRLRGSFDVILDRGCLHLLGEAGAERYVSTVARLARPGAALILKTIADETASGITLYDESRVRACFAGAFELESMAASELAGPKGVRAARLFVLRRR